MQTQRLFNALKKANLTVEKVDNKFHVQGKHYYGSFYDQDGRVQCLYICRNGEQSDAMVDHYPGFYSDTIKGFVSWLTEMGT